MKETTRRQERIQGEAEGDGTQCRPLFIKINLRSVLILKTARMKARARIGRQRIISLI